MDLDKVCGSQPLEVHGRSREVGRSSYWEGALDSDASPGSRCERIDGAGGEAGHLLNIVRAALAGQRLAKGSGRKARFALHYCMASATDFAALVMRRAVVGQAGGSFYRRSLRRDPAGT